ncbi:hypothetical protein TomTYG75_16440 [Sphingobium sp. TomTYG75]
MTGNIDQLAGDEVIGRDLGADIEERVLGDTEFDQARLRLHFRLGEVTALRLGDILDLRDARTKLNRDITVTINFLASHDLIALKGQNRNRYMPSVLLEQTGHPDFLSDHACAHH